jgi:hypothetical protein
VLNENIITNDELGRTWNKALMVYLKVLFQHSFGGTDINVRIGSLQMEFILMVVVIL